MAWGRVIGAAAAFAAVIGAATVAVAMSRVPSHSDAASGSLPSRSATYPRYAVPLQPAAASPRSEVSDPGAAPSAATAASSSAAPPVEPPAAPSPSPVHLPPAQPPAPAPAPAQRGGSLPLSFGTGDATRVITVTASSTSSTTATLQAWQAAPGGGWSPSGSSIPAHVGSAGLTDSPSEFQSATPIGSFTLTQAFGALSNPGTPLPYAQTNPSYWWISQSGPLYNTMQSCSSNCPFTQGSPNEHLYYETPYYNYAVVIDTPSGAGAYPHGSAFFLHVTDGGPTAGCVSIPQNRLVQLMQWLAPSTHPRILIGVG